jgi:hypothetical protein
MPRYLLHTAPHLLRSALIGAALCASGCAHYGWADTARPPSTKPVAVTTIGASADRMLALDVATTRLAEALRREGLVEARWAAPESPEQAAVRCAVIRLETIGVGDTLSTSLVLGCAVSSGAATWQIEAPGEAILGYQQHSAPAPIALTREAESLALVRAVDAAAPQIARVLLTQPPRDHGSQTTPQ